MTEELIINDRKVWVRIDPYRPRRVNPDIIPTEYFTATWFLEEPAPESTEGEWIRDEEGQPRLFESPVEALSVARKTLERRS